MAHDDDQFLQLEVVSKAIRLRLSIILIDDEF